MEKVSNSICVFYLSNNCIYPWESRCKKSFCIYCVLFYCVCTIVVTGIVVSQFLQSPFPTKTNRFFPHKLMESSANLFGKSIPLCRVFNEPQTRTGQLQLHCMYCSFCLGGEERIQSKQTCIVSVPFLPLHMFTLEPDPNSLPPLITRSYSLFVFVSDDCWYDPKPFTIPPLLNAWLLFVNASLKVMLVDSDAVLLLWLYWFLNFFRLKNLTGQINAIRIVW